MRLSRDEPREERKEPEATVKMRRPEDTAKKPVVADVPLSKVAEWKAQGWAEVPAE